MHLLSFSSIFINKKKISLITATRKPTPNKRRTTPPASQNKKSQNDEVF